MARCPRCRVWHLKENDFYCGFCGYAFFEVVADETVRVYMGRGQDSCELRTKVSNTGELSASLSFSLQECQPSYVSVGQLPSRIDLAPGQSKNTAIQIDFSGGGVRMAKVVLEISSRRWKKAITGYIFPQPEFGRQRGEIKVIADAEDTCQIDFPLEIRSAPEVYLRKVEITNSRDEIFVEDVPTLISTVVGEEELENRSNSSRHLIPVTLPPRFNGRLRFKFTFDGLDPVELEADVLRQERPKVGLFHYVEDGGVGIRDFGWYIEIAADAAAEDEKTVLLQNDSNYIMTFQKLGTIVSRDWLEVNVIDPITSFTLGPREEKRLRLNVRLKSEINIQKLFREQFSLQTIIDALDVKEYTIGPLQLIVEVNPLDKIDSWIALDFGTSTSVAYTNRQLIRLEGDESIIYSNILFQDPVTDSGLPYSWVIGAAARVRGWVETKRLVKSVKTKLRTNEPAKIKLSEGPINVFPNQAAQRIFSELFTLIQRKIKGRPDKVIISVPTRFTTIERERLKRACKESFGLTHIRIVDESVAVGLFYILGAGVKTFPDAEYSLMTLDFGAGTTDISFFSVTNQSGEPKRIEIRGAWGHPRLGGDDITRSIKGVLVTRLQAEGKTPDPQKGGEEHLENLAEDVKILVSEIDNWMQEKQLENVSDKQSRKMAKKFVEERINQNQIQYGSIATHLLDGSWNNDVAVGRLAKTIAKREIEVPFEREGLKITFDEVFGIYKAAFKRLLVGLAKYMKRINFQSLDVVVLAGQSCKINRIKEWMKHDNFRTIDFVKDSTGKVLLKEAVVRGESFYIDVINETGIRLLGNNMLWKPLGLLKGNTLQELLPYDAKPNTEVQFDFVRDLHSSLHLYEHLDLEGDNEKELSLYDEYTFPKSIPEQKTLRCKLTYSEDGNIAISCRDNDNWIQLKPRYGS